MANITPNLVIKKEDIYSNPELWIQKISVILFNDPQGKNYWNKNYKFIPHYQRYNEAIKWVRDNVPPFKNDQGEETPPPPTAFSEYNCRIISNENNEITIVTQNVFGKKRELEDKETEIVGKIRIKIAKEINSNSDDEEYQEKLMKRFKCRNYDEFHPLFFCDYLFKEELAELKKIKIKKGKLTEQNVSYDLARSDLAILWRKQLYFITDFQYDNNYRLIVKIWAERCPLFLYYWSCWMDRRGSGVIEKAPKLITFLKEKKLLLDRQYNLHYDFCDDLSEKKIYHRAFQSFQPKLTIVRVETKGIGGITPIKLLDGFLISDTVLVKTTAEDIKLLKDSDRLISFGSLIPGNLIRKLVKKVLDSALSFAISCEEHVKTFTNIRFGSNGSEYTSKEVFFQTQWTGEEILWDNDPIMVKMIREQPHLLSHITFHFYWLQELNLPANARYLGIKEKDGKFILPYKIFLTSAPGSVCYRIEFSHLTLVAEIRSVETFQKGGTMFDILRGFDVKFLSTGLGLTWAEEGLKWKKIEKEATSKKKSWEKRKNYLRTR